jgi:hypothetical protein
LSVPALCNQLRETQQMKSALKVENKRLREQIEKSLAAVKGGQP